MTKIEALDYIHSRTRFGSQTGLHRIQSLMQTLGNPQNSLKFIHIAGTNGKGSVAVMLAGVLKHAGYRAGMYISPYVIDFCERIQINGEMISDEDLCDITLKVKSAADTLDIPPTEFEVVTAVAFCYYAQKTCDIVVLETGLGGRFDATNIIQSPLLSIITSISLDHTDILGDTIEKIAFEKCGIIKNNGVTICSPLQPPEAVAVIKNTCSQRNNTFIQAPLLAVSHSDFSGSTLENGLHVMMIGEHQVQNASTVLAAIHQLDGTLIIPHSAIQTAFSQQSLPARMEIMRRFPMLILDGAHNHSGMCALSSALKNLSNGKIYLIIGMLKDKEIDKSLSVITPICESIAAVSPDNPRAMSAAELSEHIQDKTQNVYTFNDVMSAYLSMLALAHNDDIIVVCGSLYLASEFRSKFLRG